MSAIVQPTAEELTRANAFAGCFRSHLQRIMFEPIHASLTQKIGLIFAVTGIPAKLAYHIFGRTVEKDGDTSWLPDYSTDYGRTVIIHHDNVESEQVTLSKALSVRATGNHLIYVADRIEDLPPVIRDNASTILEPELNAFSLAVAAFREFHENLDEKQRLKFKLIDADRMPVTKLNEIFYGTDGVVKGKAFRRIEKPLAFISEIYFMFRDFAYEGELSARSVVLCADWQKPSTRSSDVSLDELADVPLLEDFPGISKVRPRLADLLGRYGSPRPPRSGVLLYGPPGTGKTMLARTIAKSTGRSLIATSVGAWQSGAHLGTFLGAMSDDFRRARDMSPSMIFIDELDSLPDRRNGSLSGFRFYESAATNRFLELVDGFTGRGDVLVIGATNNKDAIDPAVLRAGRFGEQIHIPYPDQDAIAEIINWYLQKAECDRGISVDVDADQLARRMPDIPPSSIRSVVEEAVSECNKRQEPLGVVHFEMAFDAAANAMGYTRGGALADIERTSVHEAGHAFALHRFMHNSIHSVRIGADLTTAGYVRASQDWLAPSDVKSDIARGIVFMAGRAAEYVVLGMSRVGYGNSSDIDAARSRALNLARSGLSPDGFAEFVNVSDRSEVEAAVSKWMQTFNRAAVDLLQAHSDAVADLSRFLASRPEIEGAACHDHLRGLGIASDADISKYIAS
ncbi:AAA family ATPase [Agrobacterium rubi]|nr:AAA family ATPase [Agrobacterium rubi]NTF24417.1 AAA family ATPase [Agrobacterium rubi]